MDRKQLVYSLLIGMLPLFVFIIADEMYGTKVGLIVAVTFGASELVFTYYRNRYFDKLVVFDTLLLVALGGVSLLLENDIFFKLKPALMELIMCIILGISVFTPANIIMNMTKRYMKGIEISEQQNKMMLRSIRIFFFIILIHTLLIIYSAFYMSKEAWAFISGGLFYIIMGVYFVYEFVRNRLKMRKINN